MKSAQQWIEDLNLAAHPEGGYYYETTKSAMMTKSHTGLDVPLYTNIYFLLEDDNPSHFHRLQSDEVWYFHDGSALTVHCLYPDGSYKAVRVGKNVEDGEVLMFEVPRGVIFGSSVESGYALVSAMVAPGFDFREFELFSCKDLVDKYPQHTDIIKKLTRD